MTTTPPGDVPGLRYDAKPTPRWHNLLIVLLISALLLAARAAGLLDFRRPAPPPSHAGAPLDAGR